MPPASVLIAGALVATMIMVGKPIVHGVNKADHKICHVVTLGKKCK